MLYDLDKVQGPLTEDATFAFNYYAAKDHDARAMMRSEYAEQALGALLAGDRRRCTENTDRAVAISRVMWAA